MPRAEWHPGRPWSGAAEVEAEEGRRRPCSRPQRRVRAPSEVPEVPGAQRPTAVRTSRWAHPEPTPRARRRKRQAALARPRSPEVGGQRAAWPRSPAPPGRQKGRSRPARPPPARPQPWAFSWIPGVTLVAVAPGTGFEPVTLRLTAACSTAELTRNGSNRDYRGELGPRLDRPRSRDRQPRATQRRPRRRWTAPRLFQVVLELLAARRVAELAQRLGLDLTDALAGDAKALAHFFERPLMPVDETEAQLKHTTLAGRQSVEDVLDLGAQHGQRGGIAGRGRLFVLDKVAEVGVLLLADRGLEGDGILGDLGDLADLLRGDAHLLGDLLVRRLPAQLLEKPARDPHQLVDGLHHVHRDPDGARLVGDGPRDGLPDPPSGVGRELEPLVVVELLDGPDQPHVAFLDQIQEGHASADVLLGNADHKPQVGLGEGVLGLLVALLDQLRVGDLLLSAEERHPTDLLEVHAHRVVKRHGVDGLGGGHQLLVVLHHLEILVAVGDLDPHLAEGVEDALQG